MLFFIIKNKIFYYQKRNKINKQNKINRQQQQQNKIRSLIYTILYQLQKKINYYWTIFVFVHTKSFNPQQYLNMFQKPKDTEFQHLQSNYLLYHTKHHINISVLKHISKPLEILQTQQNHLQLPDPVCYYKTKLHSLPDNIFPTQFNTNSQPVQSTKLISLQNAQFQFKQIKKNFQKSRRRTESQIQNEQVSQQQKQAKVPKVKTLYNLFSMKIPYYCRFQNHSIFKNNFANIFINVAGVNLQAKTANKSGSSNQNRRLPKLFNQNRFNSGSIIFDSNFQSGNLLYVYEVASQNDSQCSNQYNLILHNDTNTYGHNQWFFFRVQSLRPHNTVKFNVLNLIKSDSLFNYGLKPLVYSEKQSLNKNIGWKRRGENVRYFQNQIRRQNKKEFYHTLSFQYTFKQTKDWIYFSPSYPYTYSQLSHFVHNLYQEELYKKCFSVKTVSQTLGKNKINLITISTGQKMIEQCKVVWIIARQHPAETTSSYMVEGILKYLLPLISKAKISNDENLSQLNNYVFKIIPMINVDGVIHGNSRAELIGLDPNRSWKKPRKLITPDTWHVLKQILSYKDNISMILDLHSHSKKTGCFFYGNQISNNAKLSKIYPTLICENDQRFTLKNCRFHGGYKTTARHVLFQQLKIQNIFTVQCSLLGYLNTKTNRIVEYTIQDYYEMGAKLIQNFFKLEKIRLQKSVNQIIDEFSQKIQQFCQVDSAKSDSSVSDDQYQQIKQLQRKLLIRKKKSVSVKQKRNKSLIQNSVFTNLTKPLCKQERACSFMKNRNKHFNTQKLQNPLLQKSSYHLNKIRNRSITFNQSTKQIITQPQQINLSCKSKLDLINQQAKSSQQSKLKRSYMKYWANSKIFCEGLISKSKTQNAYKALIQGKDASVQALIQEKDLLIDNKRILQPSNENITSNIRPLLVLGSPCQSQFFIYNNNQVSIQVCLDQSKQSTVMSRQHKAIAKLPKLINLISSNKIKKYSIHINKNSLAKNNHDYNKETRKESKQNMQRVGSIGNKRYYIMNTKSFCNDENKRTNLLKPQKSLCK